MACWGYGSCDGPATWCNNFPDAKGQRQSPIDIKTSKVKYDAAMAAVPLTISYSPESAMCLGNTGASMKADCKQESTLTGGPLGKNVYKLIQFHLHWGAEDSRGAEHTIDGKVYSAELHLVHWNSTAYPSFAEAANKSDGLAVLCMFIKVGSTHKGFEMVSSRLGGAKFKGDQCNLVSDFNPNCLLPKDTTKYWTYAGSLTTPPCYESVQFILFKEDLEFSSEQMKALRSMHFEGKDSDCMVDNFRPTLDVGSRIVSASFPQ